MLKKPKGSFFYIFRHYEIVKNSHLSFFWKIKKNSKFFNVSEGSLLRFFLIFCNKLDFQKAQRVPPSTILRTLRFLSLGYGADFRRSRLVRSYSAKISKSRPFSLRNHNNLTKILYNPTYPAVSGKAVPESVLNATRIIEVTLQEKICLQF